MGTKKKSKVYKPSWQQKMRDTAFEAGRKEGITYAHGWQDAINGTYKEEIKELKSKLENLRTASKRYLRGEITRAEWAAVLKVSQ